MTRHYRPLLELAQDLEFFTGYLDTEDKKRQVDAQGKFDAERRRFVYDLFKEEVDHGGLSESVSGDLDRIAAHNTDYTPGSVELVRTELLKHIERQASHTPVMRFAVRWGPPALGAALLVAYLWLQANR